MPTADLKVALSASPAVVPVKGHVTYSVIVENLGPDPGTGVLTLQVPPGFTFVSCSGGCFLGGGGVSWGVGTIAPGTSRTYTAVLRPEAATGTVCTPAALPPSFFDPNPANNTATVCVTVIQTAPDEPPCVPSGASNAAAAGIWAGGGATGQCRAGPRRAGIPGRQGVRVSV